MEIELHPAGLPAPLDIQCPCRPCGDADRSPEQPSQPTTLQGPICLRKLFPYPEPAWDLISYSLWLFLLGGDDLFKLEGVVPGSFGTT
jgi:hypothetical protein